MKFVLDFCSLDSQGITAAGASQKGVEGHRMRTTYSDDRNEVNYLITMSVLRTKRKWSVSNLEYCPGSCLEGIRTAMKNLRLFADVREI